MFHPLVAALGSGGSRRPATACAVWFLSAWMTCCLGTPRACRGALPVVTPVEDSFRADWGLLLDPLSAVMILVVSGVGFLIHVYAVGYMHGDRDFPPGHERRTVRRYFRPPERQ